MASGMLKEFDVEVALHAYNKQTNVHIDELKEHQLNAIRDVLIGHDVIAALPTGYGKSLIYELLPFIIENTIIIVIEPLNVIIKQQISKLEGLACQITSKSQSDFSALQDGKYKYIYSHPEHIIGRPDVYKLFQSKHFEEARVFIVIDEAHCVLDWGEDFRPDYRKLVELRVVLPHANVLCLSATLSVKGQKDIEKYLNLKHCKVHVEMPIKSNIAISVMRRPPNSLDVKSSYRHIFDILFNELKKKLGETPLTIVYFNSSLNYIGFAYELACRVLGDMLYDGEEAPENARVIMYHASVESDGEELRDIIFKQISSENSSLRIVLASAALGMGADFGLVERVVHAGPPKTIEAYIQQVGRAGRRGNQAMAILFFNNSDVGRPEMAHSMKTFCKSESVCRRKMLNEYFGFTSNQEECSAPIKCCDICDSTLSKWDSVFPLSYEVKFALRQALMQYMLKNEMEICPETIEQILHNYSRYTENVNLSVDFSFSDVHAENVSSIIKACVSL